MALAVVSLSCAKHESMEDLTARVFERAKVQFELMDKNLSERMAEDTTVFLYPRSINPEGGLVTSNLRWWCSGFYPGSLWLVYEYTGDEAVKALAEKYTLPLDPLRFRTDDHDIGFQLMCSYGNGLRLTGNEEYIPVITDGAASLATRFDPEVGCTRSWSFSKDKWSFPVIIDNMMNMELLLKANELVPNQALVDIALAHAKTTMKNHFREDHSCWHLVDYNPETGEVNRKQTVQGYSDDSAWARGQAWAAYGYPMLYRFTQDPELLQHAINVVDYQLARLPEDGIPYWDYDAPEIPDDVKDASAAAVLACGLIELSTYVDEAKAAEYLAVAENILRTLATEEYLVAEGDTYGFLLKHSTGNKAGNSEVDVPLTYADYYFLEALLRYQKLGK